jgi:hypothetical protein
MEQLPTLLQGLRSAERVDVDFYGQGIERTLTFNRLGDSVEIRYQSRTSWRPVPDVELVEFGELCEILHQLATDFVESLKTAGIEPQQFLSN